MQGKKQNVYYKNKKKYFLWQTEWKKLSKKGLSHLAVKEGTTLKNVCNCDSKLINRRLFFFFLNYK